MKNKDFHWVFLAFNGTNLFLFVMIGDNLLWLLDEYLAISGYYVKYPRDSIHYPDRDFLNVWFHYCMKLIFVLKKIVLTMTRWGINTYEPWISPVHIRFSYRIMLHEDHWNSISMHEMFVLMSMFLVLIDSSNAKSKRMNRNTSMWFWFTLISSMINHFDVKRLLSWTWSSADKDAVEFNVVELVIIECGWCVDGWSYVSGRFCFKR